MSGELETSAAAALDKLSSAADALAAKLGTLAEKYGPEVVDAGLAVVQLGGIQNVAIGLCASVVAAVAALKTVRKVREHLSEDDAWKTWRADYDHYLHTERTDRPAKPRNAKVRNGDAAFGWFMGGGLVTACSTAAAAVHLLNLWNWVAIFAPKLWIAHRLLGI